MKPSKYFSQQRRSSFSILFIMTQNYLLYRIYRFYADGFRQMTVGRVLWTVILIKLFVIFVVLKLLFFPDVLAQKAKGGDKAEVVASELTNRK